TGASARACASRKPGSADLWRYWTARAPPARAASTLRTSSAVSGSSGVTAYRPLTLVAATRVGGRRNRIGVLRARLGLLARPEQPVRQELAHTRAICLAQRLPRVFLRLAHGFRQFEAVGEHGGDCGRERATRAMV